MRRYEVSGGDDGPYGPTFGPVYVFELAVIEASEGVSQLVQLEQSIDIDDRHIEYLLLSPRYKGDSINKLQEKGCIVGISRVLPGRVEKIREGEIANNVEYFAVGKSRRLAA